MGSKEIEFKEMNSKEMEFKVSTNKICEVKADCEIVFVVGKNFDHKWVREKAILENAGFKGEDEEVLYLAESKKLFVGAASFNHDDIRTAAAAAIRSLKKTKNKSAKIGCYTDLCPPKNIKAIVEGMELGGYSFDTYKTKKDEETKKEIIISTEDYKDETVINEAPSVEAVKEALIIAGATNFARESANTPPDDMTPKHLGELAAKIAKELKLECFIGDEHFIEKEKMGAFLAVSRASAHKPRFIHLTYKPHNPKAKIALVGKGLTYDSGGLSLKPGEHMVTMKADKSGAMAVLAVIEAAAKMKLPFEIHTIIGATENMIGGNAYKPDDVLVSRSGKTIEVRNTDAEGRLVLCDCLDYAQDLKPDYIIDMATLTGACVVALGEYTVGVMGHNGKLKHSIAAAADKSGELAGSLPFNKHLKKLLKSQVADISNISSSRYGGAITAALFLDNFIRDEYKDKWIHLDIAGPSFIEKQWGYNPAGASGAGVRLALYWMKELARCDEKKDKTHTAAACEEEK